MGYGIRIGSERPKVVNSNGGRKNKVNKQIDTKKPTARILIWERHGRICVYCGIDLEYSSLTIDHVLSERRGGENTLENLVPCCNSCNVSKGNKLLYEWLFPMKRKRPSVIHFTVERQSRNYFKALLVAHHATMQGFFEDFVEAVVKDPTLMDGMPYGKIQEEAGLKKKTP